MFPRSITKNTPKPHKTAPFGVSAGVPAAIPARKKSRLTANGALLAAFALLALTLIPAKHAAAQIAPSFGGATVVDQVYIQNTTVVNLTLPAATSGTPPLTYNLAGVGGATLNLGLTFDAAPDARVLQGTPTSQGTANFAYTVVNSIGIPDTITFRITVLNTFTFESTALVIRQTYTAGTPVSFTLPAATGGTPPLTYQLTPFSGSLPDGLAFDTTTHVLSGTPTTAQAEAGFTYTVTDSNSLSGSGPNLALTILEAPPPDVPGDGTTTVRLAVPGTITGTIDTQTDKDVFLITLVTGGVYQFDAERTGGDLDTTLGLYPPGHSDFGGATDDCFNITGVLAGNHDSAGLGAASDSRITWTATQTGNHLLCVDSHTLSDSMGDYRLTAAVTSEPPQTATITSPATLDEADLQGAALTVTLAGTEYENTLAAGQFTLTLTGGASGVSVGSVTRDSATAATLTLAYTGTGVDADTTIAVTVTAAAHAGAADLTTPSIAVAATPLAGLSVVRDLALSERRQGSRRVVSLVWQAPDTVPVGVTITGYEIQSCAQNDFTDCTTRITVTADPTSAVLRFRTLPRHWRVRALTAAGFSPWAQASLDESTPVPSTAPGPVRSLASSGITDTGVTLTWLAPSVDAEGTACVDFNSSPCGAGYVVRRGFSNGETPPGLLGDPAPVQVSIGSQLTYTDAGLLPGTTYLYEVYATNSTFPGAPVRLVVTTTGALAVTGDLTGAINEGDTAVVMGDLDITTNSGEGAFVLDAGTTGTYGTFAIGTDGGWSYSLNNAHSIVRALTAGQEVEDVFTATAAGVAAGDGSAITGTVTITITGINSPPNGIILVLSRTVAVGESIALAGARSDPDDAADTLTVSWTAVNSAGDAAGVFINPTGAGIEWIATTAAGEYTLTQTVTDPGGLFDTEQVTITVTGSGPTAAVTTSAVHVEDLDGAEVVVTLFGTQYVNTLTPGLFTLSGFGGGFCCTTVMSVNRDTATTATLTLAYTGNGLFTEDQSLIVTVLAAAHTGTNDMTTTSPLTVNADVAPAFDGGANFDVSYPVNVPIIPTRLPEAATFGNSEAEELTYRIDEDEGALPDGLTFDPDTRFLSGTPTTLTARTEFTYIASDADGNTAGTDEGTLTISIAVINALVAAAPIAPQTYPAGTPVNVILPAATGGAGMVTYAITPALPVGPDLPVGMTFDGATRLLSGAPTTEQPETLYIYTATDSANPPNIVEQTFIITIATAQPLALRAMARQTYTIDRAVNVTLAAATGGFSPYMYAIEPTPALPDGLAFTAATRVLSGTPTTEQAATTYTYTVTDSATPNNTAELTFTITIRLPSAGTERALEKTFAAFGRAFGTGTVGVFEDYLTNTGTSANTSHFTIGGHKFELATTTPAQTHPVAVGTGRDLSALATPPSFPNDRKTGSTTPLSFPNDRKTGSDSDHVFHRIGNPVEHEPTNSANTTTMSAKDLLMKSAFHFNYKGNDPTATSGWSIWARATTTNFDGKPEDDFELDGDVTSAYLGTDYQTPTGTRLGIAISQSDGEVDYDDATAEAQGDLDADLTSVLPYIQWTPSDTTTAWAMLGYGTGDAELSTDGDEETTEVDIDMQMIALGISGDLTTGQRSEWSWKASAFSVELESEADEANELPVVDASAQRLRAAIQGRAPGQISATGAQFTPNWELGLRWDDGDAEQGSGADVGLGFGYTNPASGLNVRGKTTFLVAHEAEDYEEWDASLQIRLDPGVQGRGVTFALEPGWTEDGRSQKMRMDFSNALGKWSKHGLRLELIGERTEKDDNDIGHNIRLTGSLRF